MSKIPNLVWENWLKPLIPYVILWAAFHYWLDFNNTQSIVFAFLFGTCYYAFKELEKKTEKADDFIPYHVSVRIHNPRDLLVKYKFLKAEEDWKRLQENVKETSALWHGLNFTVLSLSKDGAPHLIWWDDYKIFRAGMPSFEDELQGLEFPTNVSLDRKWSPRLYFGFRHGKGSGYHLALDVREYWWNDNKTEDTETDVDHATGSVYLILATLPYGELGLDYGKRDRATELEKLGWTIKDSDIPEIGFHTLEVENEYFSVSQRFLETD